MTMRRALTSPFRFVARRPAATLAIVVAAAIGSVVAASRMGIDLLPPSYSSALHAYTDDLGAGAEKLKALLEARYEEHFGAPEEEVRHEPHKIVVTSPQVTDLVLTESYVCQIHAQSHIEVRALEGGYLREIHVREGQVVNEGDLMFEILPVLYKAKLDAEKAEAELARLEYSNTQMLSARKVVSENEVLLSKARHAKAAAEAELAEAELGFTEIKAPFDGLVDRQLQQRGSLIKEGDVLTTLDDNRVMWVYFNVPEAQYLEYMAAESRHEEEKIELVLAGGRTFDHLGTIGAIEANFNNKTGTIAFRADFPNPDRLLRHGQTGKVVLSRLAKAAVVIPQRAVFDVLARRFVYVLDDRGAARQREITVEHELEDVFVVEKGLGGDDRIVLEGNRQVQDGETIDYEYKSPDAVMEELKHRAE